ncbi:TPA: hypothetical protein DGT35_00725 [Patescibacteria group bacterium]|nr:hypothetical protein [Patescibacteria group bacterium]
MDGMPDPGVSGSSPENPSNNTAGASELLAEDLTKLVDGLGLNLDSLLDSLPSGITEEPEGSNMGVNDTLLAYSVSFYDLAVILEEIPLPHSEGLKTLYMGSSPDRYVLGLVPIPEMFQEVRYIGSNILYLAYAIVPQNTSCSTIPYSSYALVSNTNNHISWPTGFDNYNKNSYLGDYVSEDQSWTPRSSYFAISIDPAYIGNGEKTCVAMIDTENNEVFSHLFKVHYSLFDYNYTRGIQSFFANILSLFNFLNK